MIVFNQETYTREEVFDLVVLILGELEHSMEAPLNDYLQGKNDARYEATIAHSFVVENLRQQKDGEVVISQFGT